MQDGNGLVGIDDLLLLLSEFGDNTNINADINVDAVVDVADLLLLLSDYGRLC